MEAFLVSLSTVAVAEIGDRTQLLAMVFAARYRQPVPIIAGIFVATLINHFLAGLAGTLFAHFFTPAVLTMIGGVSMVVMALWMLKPDTAPEGQIIGDRASVFIATLVGFFVADGDKTQIATVALAAVYANLVAVVAGTTTGMMVANVPAVLMGKALAGRLPLKTIHYVASAVFALMGVVFLVRAVKLWS